MLALNREETVPPRYVQHLWLEELQGDDSFRFADIRFVGLADTSPAVRDPFCPERPNNTSLLWATPPVARGAASRPTAVE